MVSSQFKLILIVLFMFFFNSQLFGGESQPKPSAHIVTKPYVLNRKSTTTRTFSVGLQSECLIFQAAFTAGTCVNCLVLQPAVIH